MGTMTKLPEQKTNTTIHFVFFLVLPTVVKEYNELLIKDEQDTFLRKILIDLIFHLKN